MTDNEQCDQPLPPLHMGLFDACRFDEYLCDLKHHARIVSIRSRPEPAPEQVLSIDELHGHFDASTIDSAQIWYWHEDELWCDTLQRKTPDVSIIRIRHGSSSEQGDARDTHGTIRDQRTDVQDPMTNQSPPDTSGRNGMKTIDER